MAEDENTMTTPGRRRPDRRAWRSLVRVDHDDEQHVFVVVPGWDPDEVIRLRKSDVPPEILERIKAGARRFHALVNIGAERSEDLLFDDWVVR